MQVKLIAKYCDINWLNAILNAIRFAPEEKEWINAFAKMSGKSFSAQVREWTLERLEDELDARDLKLALEEDNGQRVSWDEIKERYL